MYSALLSFLREEFVGSGSNVKVHFFSPGPSFLSVYVSVVDSRLEEFYSVAKARFFSNGAFLVMV